MLIFLKNYLMKLDKLSLLILIFSSYTFHLEAQEKLKKLASSFEEYYQKKSYNVYNKALKKIHYQGKFLHHVTPSGYPVFYQNRSNVAAAKSIHLEALKKGGALGIDLQGEGMIVNQNRSRVGLWEIGTARVEHQEFSDRAKIRDGSSFPGISSADDNHATHVAGTMIASGVFEEAQGMASEASLDVYNAENDLAEMALAASEGMLISNHSYGAFFPSFELWRLGYYDEDARNWDLLCYQAPFYLPVNACGNDRNETFGRKYDILVGLSTAKNPLMIGAIKSNARGISSPTQVIITNFSSFGPTDDGRIKPDLVAPGYLIQSANATSDNNYSTLSGTSMASPVVAGTLLLLQEYYQQLNNGNFMQASTLKGLTIHTALEAGENRGPDYAFGWGMIHAQNAAEHIKYNNLSTLILEETLESQGTFTKRVKATGEAPLKVTICWTDPPAKPLLENSSSFNDRTSRLVNDLDLRIEDENGNLQDLPWVLKPNQPEAPAQKADNAIDVVEQIIIQNPEVNAYYTIKVSHKGNLVDENDNIATQNFSVLISGVEENVIVNIGENIFEKVILFPNPAQDFLFLKNIPQGIHWTYNILNTEGKVVKKGNFEEKIDIRQLSSGIYTLILKNSESFKSFIWVKL